VPLYLVRVAETGREAQPGRSKTRQDIVSEIRARAPDATIRAEPATPATPATPGRLLVGADRDLDGVLREIHGIASFSPCERCDLADLDGCVVRVAARALAGRNRFRVHTRRVGRHDFTSREKSAALGAAIQAALPHAIVDLTAPEVVIGVEIRARDCYVFDSVAPGLDRDARAAAGHAAGHAAEHAGDPEPAFLVDHMLGRLVTWLRVLGYDAIYARDEADSALLRRARLEQRVLITRDHALAQARSARTLLVEARAPMEQLAEVARALGLRLDPRRMFTRCSLCNGPVQPVDKEQVRDRLPDAASALYDQLTYCPVCDKVYWKGNQYERMITFLAPLLPRTAPDRG
jgi:uncharacterized protein with PIN domain/tRNA(Ser,Leu) C12 N-acetylase TAN1